MQKHFGIVSIYAGTDDGQPVLLLEHPENPNVWGSADERAVWDSLGEDWDDAVRYAFGHGYAPESDQPADVYDDRGVSTVRYVLTPA